MNHNLHLPDYLDLEYLLQMDAAIHPREAARRDRALGLQAAPGAATLEFWLKQRRQEIVTPLPSTLFHSVRILSAWILGLLGLLAGVSLTQALLRYSGQDPVNVSVFLLVAVVPQCVLCLVSVFFLLVSRPLPLSGATLVSLVWRGAARRIDKSPAQLKLAAFLRGSGRYGRMLFLEGMRLTQLLGAAFAAGSLACLLISVVATDLAFGWQSTLQTGAAGMHHLVLALSWPWSMAPASWNLTPTLAQIEGSRIILKDGITALASADLTAWWPFLSLCLFSYAFLPRFVLGLLTQYSLRKVERSFVHPDQARIEDRMAAPLLGSQEISAQGVSVPLPLDQSKTDDFSLPQPDFSTELGCLVLGSSDLLEHLSQADVERLAEQVCGYPGVVIMPLDLDEASARQVVVACTRYKWKGGHERLMVVIEAWQPPIREALLALGILGQDNLSGRSIAVLLLGRPQGQVWLTTPTTTEEQVWIEALARLAPVRVRVITWEAE